MTCGTDTYVGTQDTIKVTRAGTMEDTVFKYVQCNVNLILQNI